MADEFGGPIPVGPFALIGNDDIGKGIVATLSGSRSPAVLMRNHGVFTIGRDGPRPRSRPRSCARTSPAPSTSPGSSASRVPIAQADVDRLYERYQNVYGQR